MILQIASHIADIAQKQTKQRQNSEHFENDSGPETWSIFPNQNRTAMKRNVSEQM